MRGLYEADWKTALSLQDRGRGREAIRVLRDLGVKLTRARPAPLDDLLEAGLHLCRMHDTEAGLTLVRAVPRLGGNEPRRLVLLALELSRIGLFAEAGEFAENALRKAPAGSPEALDAKLLWSECLDRTGRVAEALAVAEEASASHGPSIPARRLRAAALCRLGRPEEAVAALAELRTRGGPPHWETCRAWFGLGRALDLTGDPRGAWEAWTNARRHYPPGTDWGLFRSQADHVWRHVEALHASVTAEHLSKWRAAEEGRDAKMTILTGHPRSGTTLMEQALEAHRGLVSAEETTVFTSGVYRPVFQHGPPGLEPGARLDALNAGELAHWRAEYAAMIRLALRAPEKDRLILDKNPDLLQILPAVARVFPSFKVVVSLRDPRDILVSMYSQALPPNHTAYSYRDSANAARMVALRLGLWLRVREMLPPDSFHEIRYEDAVNDLPGVTGSARDFLGLTPESAPVPAAPSQPRVVRSPSYAAVAEPVHTRAVGRWRAFAPALAPHLPVLRSVIERLGYPLE